MFAIIQTGGRQVKVAPGAVVTVDRIEAEAGKEITFDQVLFLEKDGGEMLAGAPFVANAKVVGVVDGESRGPKIRVFKKKRRKGFRKTQRPPEHLHGGSGHRHRHISSCESCELMN